MSLGGTVRYDRRVAGLALSFVSFLARRLGRVGFRLYLSVDGWGGWWFDDSACDVAAEPARCRGKARRFGIGGTGRYEGSRLTATEGVVAVLERLCLWLWLWLWIWTLIEEYLQPFPRMLVHTYACTVYGLLSGRPDENHSANVPFARWATSGERRAAMTTPPFSDIRLMGCCLAASTSVLILEHLMQDGAVPSMYVPSRECSMLRIRTC